MATLYTYSDILTEVQNACVRLSLGKPSGVYDSQDENAQLMGSLANEIGPMLLDVFDWQQFRIQYSITGDGSRYAWDLPSGFSRFIDNTGWSLSKRQPVVILNAQEWAAIKSWLSQSFYVNPACRIMNDQLTFMTPPGDGEQITFEYVTKNWVIDGQNNTVKKNQLSKNSDIPMHDSVLFTQALRIKWMEVKGLNTSAVQQDFNERFREITSRNQMAMTLNLSSGTQTGFRLLDNVYNSPDTNYGT